MHYVVLTSLIFFVLAMSTNVLFEFVLFFEAKNPPHSNNNASSQTQH